MADGAWGSSLLNGSLGCAALCAVAVLAVGVSACSGPVASVTGAVGSTPATDPTLTSGGTNPTTDTTSRAGPLAVSTPVAPTGPLGTASSAPDAPQAQAGRDAASQRHPFAPTSITLLVQGVRAATASIQTIDTTPSGDLSLPADPGQVGWWQSGAMAGDAYGSVVLAGHIDSRDRGIGFFARLLRVRPGDEVELSGGAYTQAYRVVSTRDVPKASLSTGTDTFSQSVPGRLVLLTCTGPYSPTTHYPDNLVVTADPIGSTPS